MLPMRHKVILFITYIKYIKYFIIKSSVKFNMDVLH